MNLRQISLNIKRAVKCIMTENTIGVNEMFKNIRIVFTINYIVF